MEIIKAALYLAVLLTSIPAGMLLFKVCNDELKHGRKYFRLFIYISLAVLILTLLLYRNLPVILAEIYAIAVISILLIKSLKIKK